jgi:hypothetical protein
VAKSAGLLLVGLVGLFDAGAGAALLLAPEWFYANLGDFPPFNRHYAGDAGAFLLPIGIGLIVASIRPKGLGPIVALGLAASWLHAGNHLYDALYHAGQGRASIADAGLVVGMAFALTVGVVLSRMSRATA